MTLKLTIRGLGLAAMALAVMAMTSVSADAQTRRDRRQAPVGASAASVNSSYMAGPRTRVYVTKRSWLDMGTEVLPGERKYTDYAFPMSPSPYYTDTKPYGRSGPRAPTNSPLDMGGYPIAFPLY